MKRHWLELRRTIQSLGEVVGDIAASVIQTITHPGGCLRHRRSTRYGFYQFAMVVRGW